MQRFTVTVSNDKMVQSTHGMHQMTDLQQAGQIVLLSERLERKGNSSSIKLLAIKQQARGKAITNHSPRPGNEARPLLKLFYTHIAYELQQGACSFRDTCTRTGVCGNVTLSLSKQYVSTQ